MDESQLYSVDEAVARILTGVRRLPAEQVTLLNALGRALAEDVLAPVSLPPFANSSMDGYAVRAADIAAASQEAPARLKVVMDIPAGTAPDRPIKAGQAARIMTGAPMPEGADAVVPVEQTDQSWRGSGSDPMSDQVAIVSPVRSGDYVRQVGDDMAAGQVVLQAGTIVREIGRAHV